MVDLRSGQVETVEVGESIGDIAVDRNDRRVFTTGWDPEFGGVLRIVDTASARMVHTIAVGGLPTGLLVSGRRGLCRRRRRRRRHRRFNGPWCTAPTSGRPVACLAVSLDGAACTSAATTDPVSAMSVRSAGLGPRRLTLLLAAVQGYRDRLTGDHRNQEGAAVAQPGADVGHPLGHGLRVAHAGDDAL